MNAQRSGDLMPRLIQPGAIAVENMREYPDIGVRVIGQAVACAAAAVWEAMAEWVMKKEGVSEVPEVCEVPEEVIV